MIIVTAPHSQCNSEISNRHCDRKSGQAATELASILRDQGRQVQLHLADVYRSELDLNRSEARESNFRQRVRTDLTKASLLLDIHSFPWPDFRGTEIAILDNSPGTSYAWILYMVLRIFNLPAKYFIGSPANDIVREAREHQVPSLLLEYREDLSTSRIREFNSVVGYWWKLYEQPLSVPVEEICC